MAEERGLLKSALKKGINGKGVAGMEVLEPASSVPTVRGRPLASFSA